MINTVIFDLSEVLVQGMYGAEKKFASLMERDERTIWKELNTGPMKSFFLGQISEQEYWQAMVNSFGWQCSFQKFQDIFRENFYELPGTRKVVQKLLAQGFRLGLLSIHGREWIEYIEPRHRIHCLFEVRHYSYKTGLLKPDPAAFYGIMRRLRVRPDQCIFVDDSQRNVFSARALGIVSIQFQTAEMLLADLQQHGFLLDTHP